MVGTGPDSAPSPPITPVATVTVPGIPTGLSGVAGDRSVALSWTAPASDGGSPITSYRITPFIGANAQTPINTGTAGTSYTVGSLTNGTAYTFTVAATNSVGTGSPSTATPPLTPSVGYSELRFADGFESGDLVAWNGAPGNGTTSVTGAAARQGNYGLRMVNTTGQYSFLVKALSSAIADSSSIFWVKLGSGSGLQMVAQARDTSSSANMWQLYYDWGRGGFVLYPFTNTGSTEIFTGVGTGTPGSWMKVEVQYNASATGGSRLYLNGLTQPTWGVTGNYARTANLAVVQLWNDAVGTTDFDDARVSTRPPQGATLPGAPTGVAGSPRDRGAALSWTAPDFERRKRHQRVSDYAVHRRQRADADDHRLSGHELHGDGTDERDDVHVPRRGDQRHRHRRRLGGFGRNHAGCGNGAGRTDGHHRRARRLHGDRRLDAAGQRRRRSAHGLPHHPVHRLERTDPDHGERRDDDELRRDRV